MSEPEIFYDIFPISLNRAGEELCGDQVMIHRTPANTMAVISDGLGSGVKANILARLTASIIITMLRQEARLKDVIETVVGTLPSCKIRKIAYATFVIIHIEHATRHFRVINFDSPEIFLLRKESLVTLEHRVETILGKTIRFCEGEMATGDFLAAVTDGVLYAGMGTTMNFGWGRDQIAEHLCRSAPHLASSAESVVCNVMNRTRQLYGNAPGDDATFVGLLARKPRRLMVFTGPPLQKSQDESLVSRLGAFDGRKAVCGGTTANIVAEQMGEAVETDLSTLREEVPPVGRLAGIDLVTEGMLTMAKSLQLLQSCGGDVNRLPADRNGAVLLCRELLKADFIQFLAGQQVNPFYQNPLLPRNMSIRRNLVEQLASLLQTYQRAVEIHWV